MSNRTPRAEVKRVKRKKKQDFTALLARWTPTPANPICKCAGDTRCVYCELTEALREAIA